MDPLKRYGFRSYPLGCWSDGRLVGGALFRSYAVPFTGSTVTECLDGPIFLEWETGWADEFVAGLREVAGKAGSMTVTIRDCPHEEVHRGVVEALRRAGLAIALSPGP
jgi:hypothetical protein